MALFRLAKIARNRRDDARAATLYAESLSLLWDQGDKVGAAGCIRGLASVAAVFGLFERAARLFGATEALRQAIGAPIPRHHARCHRAVETVRAGLGKEAFAAAWASGRTMPLVQAIAEALEVAAAAPQASARGRIAGLATSTGLTPRELEVLTLLVADRSHREIAQPLFVSDRTVETHVHNIYAKLDIHTRRQAAAWAVRHGLAGVLPAAPPESVRGT